MTSSRRQAKCSVCNWSCPGLVDTRGFGEKGLDHGKESIFVSTGVSSSDGGVGAQSIRNWVKDADLDEGLRQDDLGGAEGEELGRLRRENRPLKLEREILAEATAWFAREAGSVPGKSSSS